MIFLIMYIESLEKLGLAYAAWENIVQDPSEIIGDVIATIIPS